MSVVVIDSDDGVRGALRMMIRRAGYPVVDVETVAAALALSSAPAFVLVRGPSTFAAAQAVARVRERWGAVPAVIVSAAGPDDPPVRRGGDTTVLCAPVSERQILDALRELRAAA